MFTQLYTLFILQMLAARFKLIVWDNFLQLKILQNVKTKKWYNTYTCTLTVTLSTENQLEFAITSTLFCDLSEMKCFAATNLTIKMLIIWRLIYLQDTGDDWFVAGNICNNEALVNLAKILHTNISLFVVSVIVV